MDAQQPSAAPWFQRSTGEVVDARGEVVAHVFRFADLPAIAAAPDLLHAAHCAMEYDAAIQKHAAKGEHWVNDGELDRLYAHWVNASAAAIAKVGSAK